MTKAGDLGWMGEYRLVARLGAGGMGEVYLAFSPGGRAVAVKTIHPHLAEDPEFRRRFAREAEAARRVGGLFTAPVLGFDSEAPVPWLATVFVAGPDLAEVVAATGPLPDGSVRSVGAGLAEALLSIHGAGLAHRDLKPGNVLLSATGPRIIDFGLARTEDATALTDTGQAMGTPGYLPPEVLEGAPAGPAGDVFALSGVLAFAATGRHPYGEGPVVAILSRVLREPPDLEGIGPGLRELLAAGLRIDPEERPGADELLGVLGATGDLGGPAPLPRAVTARIAEREAWAAELQATVPYEGPPEPAPSTSKRPRPTVKRERRGDPATEAPLTRPRRRLSGRMLLLGSVVVALILVAGFLLPHVWSGNDDPGDLAAPSRNTEPESGPAEYVLVADHEIDVPLPEETWHQSLALSPDGDTAYMKGSATPVLAVDTATGEPLYAGEGSTSGAITVAPDGSALTVHTTGESRPREGTWDDAEPVVIMDAENGDTIAETTVGARGGEVAFTPEGDLVVTSPWGGTDLFDVQDGRRLRNLAPTGGQRLALSSDGSLVAFLRETAEGEDRADAPSRIEVWTFTGERVTEIDARADGNYGHLSFQPGTTQLTAIGRDDVRMWDAATGEDLGGFAHDLDIAPRAVVDGGTGLLLAWSLGGGFASVDLDARASLGPVSASEEGATVETATNTVHVGMSADGGVLVRLGFERSEEETVYHLYVWERV